MGSAASYHAQIALTLPNTHEYKLVSFDENGRLILKLLKPKLDEAHKELGYILIDQGLKPAETLGHIGFKLLSDTISARLAEVKETGLASQMQQNILKVMDKRGVKLPNLVKEDINKRIADYHD